MEQIEFVKLTVEERDALRRVVSYLWESEAQDFRATQAGTPEKENHVFRALTRLEPVLSRESQFEK